MTIVGEPITSALNTRSWQSGRINEGMTPKQCHANHYHSQQVEGSAGWDRNSSGDRKSTRLNSSHSRRSRMPSSA